ncbi:histone-lysine N-methyltransferase SETMAR [Trichonephila clavipes]|nr:histone-lysine N-methyltransferase SETMAR [Trichonephila clavipes]
MPLKPHRVGAPMLVKSVVAKGIFDVKDAPRTGRPFVENVDKITEIIEVDWYVSSRSITLELNMDHKTVLKHLRKVGFKKKLRLGATPKHQKP